jgi:hypothetical protein
LEHPCLPLAEPGRSADTLLDRPLLDLVAEHDRGLVHYNADCVQPALLAVQLAKAWPDRNITFLVNKRDDALVLARQLRAAGVDAFAFTGRNQICVEKRVAVATYMGMAGNPIEPEKQDIAVALDAAHAVGKDHFYYMSFLHRARLYGLLAAHRHLSPVENDLVRCLFGFEEVQIPRHGYQVRPVGIHWAAGKGRRLRYGPANDLELKRYGVWYQEGRNRYVARLARAFAAGNKGQLQTLLPSFPQAAIPAGPCNVLVLVENLEHALKLMAKLPGWPLITGGLVNLDGLPSAQKAEVQDTLAAGAPPGPRCAIVTQAGLGHVKVQLGAVDVLLRADAGTGLPGLPAEALVQPVGECLLPPLLVVDLEDRHHGELRRRAERRHRAYVASGWTLAGFRPSHLRVKQFILDKTKGARR